MGFEYEYATDVFSSEARKKQQNKKKLETGRLKFVNKFKFYQLAMSPNLPIQIIEHIESMFFL